MKQKLLKNLPLSKTLGVSHPTIGKWVDEAADKQNNLQIAEQNGRYYIIDNPHNQAELFRLAERAKKYRNKIAYEKVTPSQKIYETFTTSQLIELINELEQANTIPFKFTYLNGGADIWEKHYNLLSADKDSYINDDIKLLNSNRLYLDLKLARYQTINIVDIGPGNGYPIKQIIEGLIHKQKQIRYTAIDISTQMLHNVESNMRSWFPTITVETERGDLENTIIRDRLFFNKSNNHNSCNVIFFFGGTIGNVADRHRVFLNLKQSMSKDDFLVINNSIDNIKYRTSFNSVDMHSGSELISWIPAELGLKENSFTRVNKYDTKSEARLQTLRLKKDIDMVFQIQDTQKIINFKENEEIIIFRHYSHTIPGFLTEIHDSGMEISHFSVFPDKSQFLALCEVAK